ALSPAAGLLLAVTIAAAGAGPAEKRVELKQGDRILFFGDSLTALAGSEQPKKFVTKGYVRIVREALQAAHKDKGIEVDWVATGGHTVPPLPKRVGPAGIANKPTGGVIQIRCHTTPPPPPGECRAGPDATKRRV